MKVQWLMKNPHCLSIQKKVIFAKQDWHYPDDFDLRSPVIQTYFFFFLEKKCYPYRTSARQMNPPTLLRDHSK